MCIIVEEIIVFDDLSLILSHLEEHVLKIRKNDALLSLRLRVSFIVKVFTTL